MGCSASVAIAPEAAAPPDKGTEQKQPERPVSPMDMGPAIPKGMHSGSNGEALSGCRTPEKAMHITPAGTPTLPGRSVGEPSPLTPSGVDWKLHSASNTPTNESRQ